MLPMRRVLKHLRGRTATATLSALICILTVVVPTTPAHASIASDQAQIDQLTQKIASEGDHVQDLVAKYNATQSHLNDLNAQIKRDQQTLNADQQAEQVALRTAQSAAVRAYVTNSGFDTPALQVFSDTSTLTNMASQNHYLSVLSGTLNDALDSLKVEQDNVKHAQATLVSEQDDANRQLKQLTSQRSDADKAIASDQALLSSVKSDQRTLVQKAMQERARQQEAAERALAAAQAAAAAAQAQQVANTPSTNGVVTNDPPPTNVPNPGPPKPSPPGVYGNPLRAIGVVPERIDQGVDFAGSGPIYAIGNGTVLSTSGPGWPGGTFIAYTLSDGPAAGLTVYCAEDILPSVSPGQTVSKDTVLGQVYAGPTGIELGWANPNRIPDTMAKTYGQYHGGNSTAFGYNFSRFLQSLGAPGGILAGGVSGSLPSNWPRW